VRRRARLFPTAAHPAARHTLPTARHCPSRHASRVTATNRGRQHLHCSSGSIPKSGSRSPTRPRMAVRARRSSSSRLMNSSSARDICPGSPSPQDGGARGRQTHPQHPEQTGIGGPTRLPPSAQPDGPPRRVAQQFVCDIARCLPRVRRLPGPGTAARSNPFCVHARQLPDRYLAPSLRSACTGPPWAHAGSFAPIRPASVHPHSFAW
jgi:hypothetical protein